MKEEIKIYCIQCEEITSWTSAATTAKCNQCDNVVPYGLSLNKNTSTAEEFLVQHFDNKYGDESFDKMVNIKINDVIEVMEQYSLSYPKEGEEEDPRLTAINKDNEGGNPDNPQRKIKDIDTPVSKETTSSKEFVATNSNSETVFTANDVKKSLEVKDIDTTTAEELYLKTYGNPNTRTEYRHTPNQMIEFAEFYSNKPDSKLDWISVEDRLPSDGESVLGVIQHTNSITIKSVWYGKYYDTDRDVPKWYSGNYETTVTHWMPLPSPPKD